MGGFGHGTSQTVNVNEENPHISTKLLSMRGFFKRSIFSADDVYKSPVDNSTVRDAFFNLYKQTVEYFDVVWCQYPLLLCSYFLPFDVKVVARVTHRFDYFACDGHSRATIGEYIRVISSKGSL